MTAVDQINFYGQHTELDPTRRSYAVGEQAASSVVRMAAEAGTVAVDLETAGLGADAFRVKVMIISTDRTACVLDASNEAHRRACWDALRAAQRLVFHNSAFDVPPLVTSGLMHLDDIDKVFDTLVCARMALTGFGARRGLGDLEKRYLQGALRSATKDRFGDWAKVNGLTKGEAFKVAGYEHPVYAAYAGWDGILTAMIEPHVIADARRQLTDHPFGRYGADAETADYLIEREQRVNRVMLRRSARGLAVDPERLDTEQDRLRVRMNALADDLTEFGVKDPSNRNQLAAVLEAAGALGEDYPHTATGKVSTAKEHLDAVQHPAAVSFREHDQNRRLFTYLEHARLVAERTDGRIHPQVNVLHARTGRMSYSNPELHQFLPDARTVIRRDDEHAGLVSIDWSSIEPVTVANLAGDIGPVEQFESGKKLYDVVSSVAGVSYKTAKVVCVPLDTEILTRRGWLRHNQVRVGDHTLDHRGCWTSVTEVHHPGVADLVRMRHSHRFDVICTPDHRWFTGRRDGRNRPSRTTLPRRFAIRPTSELTSEDALVLSVLADGGELPITPDEAAVIGWAYTDGTVKISPLAERGPSQGSLGHRRWHFASICQSKPENVAIIDKLLQEVPHSRDVHAIRPGQTWPQVVWRLPSPWVRDVWSRAKISSADDLVQVVLGLSAQARCRFAEAGLQAEGHRNVRGGQRHFTQNDGPVLEAFHLAFHLEGQYVRRSLKHRAGSVTSNGYRSSRDAYVLGISSPTVTMQRVTTTTEPSAEVWCVTTESGTWTMRQNGRMMLTGNCLAALYGQGIRSLARNLGVEPEQAKALQAKVFEALPRTRRFVGWAAAWSEEVGKTWTVSGRIVDVDRDAGYKGVNYSVQGSAYDVLAETIVSIDEAGLADALYLTLHDECVVAEEAAHAVRRIMQRPPDRLCELSGRVPKLRTDAAYLGEHWDDADRHPSWPLDAS